MNPEEFNNFFKPYSQNVDSAKNLGFWKLSDDLITEIIKKHISTDISSEQVILDAGGGTGRWICDLSKIYNSKFVLYDLSKDMLEVAKKNITKAGVENRVTIVQGNLTDMSQIEGESIDNIVSIYSPISFVYEKEKAISELHRVLKKGGKLIIMGHGYYNAIDSKINNYGSEPSELEELVSNEQVKWGIHVPKLNVFSQETMDVMLKDSGFNIERNYGVPVFVRPGVEDWDSTNSQKSNISKRLEDQEFYNKVFELEMKFNSLPESVNRGMNIFTVAVK